MANVNNYIAAGNSAVRKNLKIREALSENKTDFGALGQAAIQADREEKIAIIKANAKVTNASTDGATRIKGADITVDRDKSIAASKRGARKAGLLAGGALILGLANKERLRKDEPDLYQEMLQQQLLGRNQSITDLRTEVDEMRTELENSTPGEIPTGDATIPLSPEGPGTKPIQSQESLSPTQGSNGFGQTLTQGQIRQLAIEEGWSPEEAHQISAIAMAESSGNSGAHNPNRSTGDNSFGIMQINMIDGMGPERRAQFGIESNEELFNPSTNMRAARQIYEQQGLGAWSAYTNGSYQNFMKL